MFENNDENRFFTHLEDLQLTDFSESTEFDWFDFRSQLKKNKVAKGITALMRIVKRDHTGKVAIS